MKDLVSQEMEKPLGMVRLNWQTRNVGSGRYWEVRQRGQTREGTIETWGLIR